jgi:hypothetical protein
MRVGAGRTSSEIKRTNAEGMIESTTDIGEFAIGLDSTVFAELPFSIESGIVTEFHRAGLYLEGGYLRRLLPNLRVGATGGGEYWWSENFGGVGVRAGLTLEYVRRFRQRTYSETSGSGSNDETTYHITESGSPGIGLFLDAGYRSLVREKYGYVVGGLSIRLPAMAGIADFTKQH